MAVVAAKPDQECPRTPLPPPTLGVQCARNVVLPLVKPYAYTLPLHFLFILCSIFKEFYASTKHSIPSLFTY